MTPLPVSTPSATSSASRCWPTKPPTKPKSPQKSSPANNAAFDAKTIPNVAYTDPEIAWIGMMESDAKAAGIEYDKAVFPWAANGRALGTAWDEGLTKVLFDKKTKHILGAGIVGVNAGELIADAVLALEMGADAEGIGLSIHPPTLSETFAMAAEIVGGTITDLYVPKK